MKTKANQSAAERNITMVALADIQPSGTPKPTSGVMTPFWRKPMKW